MKIMKTIKKILFAIFILFPSQNLAANNTWFSKNKTYSGQIKFKGLPFQLLDGEWAVANKYSWHFMGISSEGVTLVQIEKNTIKALFEISELTTGGKKQALISQWLNRAYFNSVTDGCYEKSEYYLVKFWQKGMSANCLRVRHIDVRKEMYNPDYKVDADGYSEPYQYAAFKNFIKKRNLDIPKILISHQHIFNSPFHGGRAFLIYVDRNPEFFDAGKTLIGDEKNSEYHKANLDTHPKKKKIVNKIIQKSYSFHRDFEDKLKVKEYQKLDLGIKIDKEDKKKDDLVVNQLERLNKLYESGSITEKEFKAAKQKILK